MRNKSENIFDVGPCLTAEELLAYAEGRLRGADAHRAEKHLLECGFCSDALEGIVSSGTADRMPQILQELNGQVDDSVKASAIRPAGFSYRRMAAIVILLILAGGMWIYIGQMNKREKLFSQYYEPYHQRTDSVAGMPHAEESSPMQQSAVEREDEDRSAIRSVQSNGNKAVTKVKEGGTKTMKEEKAVEDATEKDLTATDLTSSGVTAPVTAEGTTTQADAVKSFDEIVVTQVETKKSKAAKSPANEQAPARPDHAEPLLKETTVAAFSAKRETEHAEAQVDAKQLQRATLDQAIQHYYKKEYEEAFQQAEKFLKKFPKDPEGLFFSGVSALSLHKEKVAASRLEDCLETGAQQWKEDASWYLALSYVKLGKSGEAKPHLEFLAAGNGSHAAEAKTMLETIR